MLVLFAFLFGVAFSVVSFMPNAISAFFILLLVGAASMNFLSLGNTILQLETVPEMRGRVMSLWAIAFLGSTPIGGPIIGWIGDHIGPRYGVLTGGLAAILAAGIGAMTLLKIPKTLPDLASEPSARLNAEELNIQEDQKTR
jgi:MFS family permease